MKSLSCTSEYERAVVAHVAPFGVWLLLQLVPIGPAVNYALRTVVVALLAALLRPWRWYGFRLTWRTTGFALLVGTITFVVWVAPETESFATHMPGLQKWYVRVGRLGSKAISPAAFDPTVWTRLFLAVRLFGSAFVIAPAEEFFWRGFFYRLTFGREFLRVPLDAFSVCRFILVAVLFGLEHQRWLAGVVAGTLYTTLMIRTRALEPAVLAHATTNLLLGLYVVLTGSYHFW